MFSFMAQAYECEKLVVTAHPEYPPYHWRDGTKIVGASVDITREVLAEIDIELEAKHFGPWKRVLTSAQDNRFDAILALKKTEKRSRFLDYTSSPILPNPFAVFVLKHREFDFQEWIDLIDKRGGEERRGSLWRCV